MNVIMSSMEWVSMCEICKTETWASLPVYFCREQRDERDLGEEESTHAAAFVG